MNTWQIKWLTCVLAAGLVSCAHSGDSQVLQYRGSVQPQRSGASCLAADASRLIVYPVLDLSLAGSYRFFPVLKSLMLPLTGIQGVNPSTIDTNTIVLSSMQVSVVSGMVSSAVGPTGATKATPFGQKGTAGVSSTYPTSTWTVPISGTLEAGAVLITAADLVPEKALVGSKYVPIGEDWRSRFYTAAAASDFSSVDIVLSFQFLGTTLSGDNVITDAATTPMTVCYGCLLTPATVSANAADYWAGCGTAAVPAGFEPPCLPGQEDFVDCRFYCHQCQEAKVLKSAAYDGCNTATLCKP